MPPVPHQSKLLSTTSKDSMGPPMTVRSTSLTPSTKLSLETKCENLSCSKHLSTPMQGPLPRSYATVGTKIGTPQKGTYSGGPACFKSDLHTLVKALLEPVLTLSGEAAHVKYTVWREDYVNSALQLTGGVSENWTCVQP